jgi:maltokinase
VSIRESALAGEMTFLDNVELGAWLVKRRWFASKAREVASFGPIAAVPVREDDPLIVIALVEARFHTGTHELYQVPLGMRPAAEGWTEGAICEADGWTVYDALKDPEHGRAMLALMRDSREIESAGGVARFSPADGIPAAARVVRAMGAEQSNTSLVFDEASVLKVYRRLEPGINPELELLRFLSAHDFAHVPKLLGWSEFSGRLMEATLGVLQTFVAGGLDGWELALDEAPVAGFIDRCRSLGEVTGAMHSVLGSDASDPAFTPDEPSVESLALLTATVDDEIERIFRDLPDVPAVSPIAGREEEVREKLRELTHVAAGGKVIRTHGDYHLGQTLLADGQWVILDFEGEPARTLPERRRKRSPLRDVAGMLRSFAYVSSAAGLLRGKPAPEGWEGQAREEFLAGYFARVDPALLPPGDAATQTLLSIFELEKAVYELRYELNNRPDWVEIPVRGIARLLEESGR